MLVSLSCVGRSESAEPGLDPGGDKTPGLVAIVGLEEVWGLESANKCGQTIEWLVKGCLDEAVLLSGQVLFAFSSPKKQQK